MATPVADLPPGWILHEWGALDRRPLVLGLPYGAIAALFLVAGFFIGVLKLIAAGLLMVFVLWGLGALLTRYDPFGWETMLQAGRMPRLLRGR